MGSMWKIERNIRYLFEQINKLFYNTLINIFRIRLVALIPLLCISGDLAYQSFSVLRIDKLIGIDLLDHFHHAWLTVDLQIFCDHLKDIIVDIFQFGLLSLMSKHLT